MNIVYIYDNFFFITVFVYNMFLRVFKKLKGLGYYEYKCGTEEGSEKF